MVPEIMRSESAAIARSTTVSPFAADSARKSGSKPELSSASSSQSGSHAVASGTASVVMGSAAPAVIALPAPEISSVPVSAPETAHALTPEVSQPPQSVRAVDSGNVRGSVLSALAEAGQRMLSAMLETGQWQVEGTDLIIKVASSATVIEMSLGADAKRLIVATASGILGRPVRLKVLSGGALQPAPRNLLPTNGGGRGRAEQDPVVHRMKEKFDAEIRTIIDYREKR
jgi:hypothetical protein